MSTKHSRKTFPSISVWKVFFVFSSCLISSLELFYKLFYKKYNWKHFDFIWKCLLHDQFRSFWSDLHNEPISFTISITNCRNFKQYQCYYYGESSSWHWRLNSCIVLVSRQFIMWRSCSLVKLTSTFLKSRGQKSFLKIIFEFLVLKTCCFLQLVYHEKLRIEFFVKNVI